MSKRLLFLEKLLADGKADAFAIYALALEYKGLERIDEALATFETLRARDAGYVPMYLMCGTMLAATAPEKAREWLTTGVTVARDKGDTKALSEIQDALSSL